MLIGLALTLSSFIYVKRSGDERLEHRFERETSNLAIAVERQIENYIDILYDVRDYFNAVPVITRAGFATFGRDQLTRHSAVQAIEWVPRVRLSDRAGVETARRREGTPGFSFVEAGPGGRLVPARPRPVYYPVLYVEPVAGNEPAIGFAPDWPARNQAMARAADSGKPVATSRFQAIQTQSGEYSVAIFLPLYHGLALPPTVAERRTKLRGFVQGVFRIDEMLRTPLKEAASTGIDVRLTDESFGDAPGLVLAAQGAADQGEEHAKERLKRDVPFDMSGRPWLLSFSLGNPHQLENEPGQSWLVLIAGLAATGLLGGYLSTMLDQRSQMEQVVAERTEALRQEQELARRYKELDSLKNNFASAVSHDLRTPLTSIVGYAEFLEDQIGGELSEQQRSFVTQIVRGAKRLEHLVDDLLDFARIDAGTFQLRREPADFRLMVQDVAESLGPQLEEAGLQLEVAGDAAPLTGTMDAARIERVMFNLLHNAIKFTPRGGTIRVNAWPEEAGIYCEVADTGIGIAEDQIPRLFQRFSQLKSGSEKGGTGLGLSICHAIIEAHAGQIGVRSKPAEGSVFWFRLPWS